LHIGFAKLYLFFRIWVERLNGQENVRHIIGGQKQGFATINTSAQLLDTFRNHTLAYATV
jgi:hypothetical protein